MHNATGGFPPELATPGLQGLYLSKANLSGPLPGLANMTSLREAILDGNRFTGVSFRKRNGIHPVVWLPQTMPLLSLGLSLTHVWMLASQLAAFIVNVLHHVLLCCCIHAGTLPGTLAPTLQRLSLAGNQVGENLPPQVSCHQQPAVCNCLG